MTTYSHDTRVETIACVPWPGRNPFGNRDTMTKVTQGDGSVEYNVYPSGSDPYGYDNEAEARAHFARMCNQRFER